MKNQDKAEHGHNGDQHPAEIPITIDKKPYKAPKPIMTGAELRQLADPHIGDDLDLWHVMRGPGDDTKVGDEQPVELAEGDRFYSAPRKINPGAVGAAR
jgi:hypothetical protein